MPQTIRQTVHCSAADSLQGSRTWSTWPSSGVISAVWTSTPPVDGGDEPPSDPVAEDGGGATIAPARASEPSLPSVDFGSFTPFASIWRREEGPGAENTGSAGTSRLVVLIEAEERADVERAPDFAFIFRELAKTSFLVRGGDDSASVVAVDVERVVAEEPLGKVNTGAVSDELIFAEDDLLLIIGFGFGRRLVGRLLTGRVVREGRDGELMRELERSRVNAAGRGAAGAE